MKIWKVILVTLVIFGAGVMTGSLLATRSQSASKTDASLGGQPQREGMRPERAMRMNFVGRLKEELNLTPEQLGKIEVIVQESQKRTRDIWEQCSPQMRAEYKATKEKIEAVLTEEQKEQFKEMMKQHRPRKDDSESDGPPPREPLPPAPHSE